MRTSVPVTYVHSDHLGSASLTTNDTNGTLVTAMRDLPFGDQPLSSNLPSLKRTNKLVLVTPGINDILPNLRAGTTLFQSGRLCDKNLWRLDPPCARRFKQCIVNQRLIPEISFDPHIVS